MKISLSCEFKSCLFLSVLFFPEGSTEREFLSNIETIVRNSLLHDKLKSYFADPESAKEALLNKVTVSLIY